MEKKKLSFSKRLSLNVLTVTSILFILAIAFAGFYSHYLIADEATRSAERLLDATVLKIERTLQDVEMTVGASEWLVEEKKNDKEYLYHITQEIVKGNEHIVGSAVGFIPDYFEGVHYFAPYTYRDQGSGVLASMQLGNDKYDYFNMEWFSRPKEEGKAGWSEPYFDEGGGEYLMSTYSYPVRDKEGNIFAVITADISLEWISQYLDGIKPYKGSYVTLLSDEGRYITLGQNNVLAGRDVFSTYSDLSSKTAKEDVKILIDSMMSGEKGTMPYRVGNSVSFAVFGPLSNGWIASITCSYKDVLARASEMQFILILIGLLSLIILFTVCYLAIRKMTKPLTDFSDSALSIAGGDFNTKLPSLEYDDEIMKLRNSFDTMQKSLTDYMVNLKASTAANERFESELNIAAKIQESMLPTNFPDSSLVDIHAMMKPAKEVGGDLYDFKLDGHSLYMLVGDVSGKGIPASLVMSITKYAFRFLSNMDLDVAQLVSKVNDSVCDGNDTGMFVTLFLGRLNLDTGELLYCNAGHNPVVIVPPSGQARFLETKSNIALGVFSGFPYELQSVKLEKNTRLLLYTDGVTEAERADKSLFGEERLLRWADTTESFDAATACKDLLDCVKEYTAGNEQNDDITIMTIKYL